MSIRFQMLALLPVAVLAQACTQPNVQDAYSPFSYYGRAGLLPRGVCSHCANGAACLNGRCQCPQNRQGVVCQYEVGKLPATCNTFSSLTLNCELCYQYLAAVQNAADSTDLIDYLNKGAMTVPSTAAAILYSLKLDAAGLGGMSLMFGELRKKAAYSAWGQNFIDCRQQYCTLAMGSASYFYFFSGATPPKAQISIPLYIETDFNRSFVRFSCPLNLNGTSPLTLNFTRGLKLTCVYDTSKLVAGPLVPVVPLSVTLTSLVRRDLTDLRLENIFTSFGVLFSFILLLLFLAFVVVLFFSKYRKEKVEDEEPTVLLRSLHPFFSIYLKPYSEANEALLLFVTEVALLALVQSLMLLAHKDRDIEFFLLSLPVIPITAFLEYLIGWVRLSCLRQWKTGRVVFVAVELTAVVLLLWTLQDTSVSGPAAVGFIVNLCIDLLLSGLSILVCGCFLESRPERVEKLLWVLVYRGFLMGLWEEEAQSRESSPSLTERLLGRA